MKIRVNNSKNDLLDPDSFSQHGAKPSGFRQSADHLLHGKIPRQSPRLRGNHPTKHHGKVRHLGSPPLTREPHISLPQKPRHRRITPAYAGTTSLRPLLQIFQKDHPRLRGNHHLHRESCWKEPGSPPLAREPLFLCPLVS